MDCQPRSVPGVQFGGDGKGRLVSIKAPMAFGCVMAFVDAHAILTDGNDVAILQLPVHVVQGGSEGEEFRASKGQHGPGAENGEADGRRQGWHGDKQQHIAVVAPSGRMVGLGDDDQLLPAAAAMDHGYTVSEAGSWGMFLCLGNALNLCLLSRIIKIVNRRLHGLRETRERV